MKILHCNRLMSLGLLVALLFLSTAVVGQAQERAVIIPASPAEVHQKQEVFTFLEEYFSVLARGEMAKLADFHPSLSPDQLETLRHYFTRTIRDLHIQLQDVRVQVATNTATVAFYRTDRFIDRPTGKRIKKSIRLSTRLVQGAAGWRLAGLDQVAFALGDSKTRTG
jgi:hypothetical protein